MNKNTLFLVNRNKLLSKLGNNLLRKVNFKFCTSLPSDVNSFSFIDKDKVQFFKDNGYAVLTNVFSEHTIENLKAEMNSLIQTQDPKKIGDIFRAGMNFTSSYFLDSGDKINFFLEADSYDEKGNLKYDLKDCINKAGHGIHDVNPVFRDFSYSPQIKHILKSIGYICPSIVQSMYILKSKRIGGEVTPHTDNTYIRSKPLSCTGVWIALDDATIENGALYGVPKSHLKQTEYFMSLVADQNGLRKTIYNKDKAPEYDLEDAVPLEAKKGSVVLLHGDFVHFSYSNSSEKQRHAYTIHVVETGGEYIWEKDNWLHRKDIPFRVINLGQEEMKHDGIN
jgi:phytanoyl-CoA hydroxylase